MFRKRKFEDLSYEEKKYQLDRQFTLTIVFSAGALGFAVMFAIVMALRSM